MMIQNTPIGDCSAFHRNRTIGCARCNLHGVLMIPVGMLSSSSLRLNHHFLNAEDARRCCSLRPSARGFSNSLTMYVGQVCPLRYSSISIVESHEFICYSFGPLKINTVFIFCRLCSRSSTGTQNLPSQHVSLLNIPVLYVSVDARTDRNTCIA